MRYVIGFVMFWYDFIIGDDWTIAAAVVVALSATYLLAHKGMVFFWLLPVAVLLFLGVSVWRASRSS